MTEIIDGLNAGVLKWNGADVQISPVPMPVIYFDHAPSLSHLNGVIGITLTVTGNVPMSDGGVRTVAGIVAHLKCNIPAALALKGAIESALLLAQPAAESAEGKAN